jgi:chromosome segregation ATPase
MRRTFRTSLLSAALLAAVVPSMAQAYSWTFVYREHPEMVRPRRGYSVDAGLRKEISKAQGDLARAYSAAGRLNPADAETKAAQDELDQARKDYQTAVDAAKASLAKYPAIQRLRASVKELEAQLNAASNPDDRVRIAAQLMPMRNELNKAEWDVLGVDPDIAITKKAVADATDKIRQVQVRRQAQLQQDPAVMEARQRLSALRAQQSPRR